MLNPLFTTRPMAHRGLHGPGVPENSLAAMEAAVAAGYGIEIDIQRSRDGVPLVFHDDDLRRMTGVAGPVAACDFADLPPLADGAPIPDLAGFLAQLAGRAPLLVEIKDQDGALGPEAGPLGREVSDLIAAYAGPVAVMSFNPHMLTDLAPGLAVGRTTDGCDPAHWPGVPPARLAALRDIDPARWDFISHDHRNLARVADLDLPILSWTIRTADEETAARRIACNITFESYRPAHP